jgi:hypothetical protein
LSILLCVALCGVYGLHRVTMPVSYTKEEYEKRLKKGSGIAAGAMNALMYPLQQLLHPKAVEAVHVIKNVRQGYYDSQQETGDGLDNQGLVVHQARSRDGLKVRSSRSRVSQLLQRVLKVFGLGR